MTQSELLIAELCSRFLLKPRQCRKINDSFIGSAQRILCISNNTFYYYPKIQEFRDLDFDKLQYVVPKAGVKLKQILELRFPPRRKNQRNYFSIVIPKNKILKYTKTYKEMIVDEEAEGQQIWTFSFDYDIVALPQIQIRLQRVVQNERQAQKQRQEQIKLEKQKVKRLKQQKIQQQYQSLKDAEMFSQTTQQLGANQQKQLQLQRKQHKKRQLIQADQLSFHYIYRKLIYKENMNDQQLLLLELQLLERVGSFIQRAQEAVKSYVDCLPFNPEKPKLNVYFKNDTNLYLKLGDKNLNQEFLSNYHISAAMYKNKKYFKFQKELRVPLQALIKYKGFKILVRSVTPVDLYQKEKADDLIIHGNAGQSWKNHFLAIDDLTKICDELNLKSYYSQIHYQKVQIHLGVNLKLVQTQQNPFNNIKSIDPSHYTEDSNYKMTYVLHVDEIFPIDLDLQNNINQATVRLRPQFVANFVDFDPKKPQKLSNGGLLYAIDDQEGRMEDYLVARASQYLKYHALGQFVKQLDDLKFIPYSSKSFSKFMKQNGINIRYLQRISKLSALPYIKELCMIEGIARCIKKFYREHQRQFCASIFKYMHTDLIKEAYDFKQGVSLRKIRFKQLKSAQEEVSRSNAIDFLNLIFGNTIQTQKFWQMLATTVNSTYKIIIKQQLDLAQGYLLLSVLEHCGFHIIINNNLNLFLTATPFNLRDWIGFRCKTVSFDFPCMHLYEKTVIDPKWPPQTVTNRLELSLLVRRALKKDQNSIMVELSKCNKSIQPPTQKYSYQSLIYYIEHASQENFHLAHRICQFILPPSHPLYLELYLKYAQIKDFDPLMLKKAAKQHSIRNLGITHWKTSEILAQFKEQDYIIHLTKAESGVNPQKTMALYLSIVKELSKVGKLIDCIIYVRKAITLYKERNGQLTAEQQEDYFKILGIGIQVNYQMCRVEDMLKLSQYLWNALQKQQYAETFWYQFLLQECTKVYLESYNKKYYMFKLVIALEERTAKHISLNLRKEKIQWLRDNCVESRNHINWIKELLTKLEFGFIELNFLPDFFLAFDKNVQKLGTQQFLQGLNQLKTLIEIFGLSYFEEALVNKIHSLDKSTLID